MLQAGLQKRNLQKRLNHASTLKHLKGGYQKKGRDSDIETSPAVPNTSVKLHRYRILKMTSSAHISCRNTIILKQGFVKNYDTSTKKISIPPSSIRDAFLLVVSERDQFLQLVHVCFRSFEFVQHLVLVRQTPFLSFDNRDV